MQMRWRIKNVKEYPEMMVATANYWTIIHGMEPGEVTQDEEGVHVMHTLVKNMAWQLKMREQGIAIAPPKTEKPRTNFIR